MAYDITLEGKNNMEALQLLENVSKILQKNNLDYWLEGGTLLGIRRENRLLPWDNDVDLSMMYPGDNNLDLLISELKKNGLRIRVRNFSAPCHPLSLDTVKIIKIRNKKLLGLMKGKVCLEIFIKYKIKEQAYWQIGDKVKSVPYAFYKELKTTSFKGYHYKIPKDTDSYLSYRYGDWKTPVKDWNTFTDDKAIK